VSWALQIAKTEQTIWMLYQRYKDGELVLDPDFQRAFVWDEERQAKLVESVLTGIPLPVIYLSEEDDAQNHVIDGPSSMGRRSPNSIASSGAASRTPPSPASLFSRVGMRPSSSRSSSASMSLSGRAGRAGSAV
jgi:Protein of unknown function DUF262